MTTKAKNKANEKPRKLAVNKEKVRDLPGGEKRGNVRGGAMTVYTKGACFGTLA